MSPTVSAQRGHVPGDRGVLGTFSLCPRRDAWGCRTFWGSSALQRGWRVSPRLSCMAPWGSGCLGHSAPPLINTKCEDTSRAARTLGPAVQPCFLLPAAQGSTGWGCSRHSVMGVEKAAFLRKGLSPLQMLVTPWRGGKRRGPCQQLSPSGASRAGCWGTYWQAAGLLQPEAAGLLCAVVVGLQLEAV